MRPKSSTIVNVWLGMALLGGVLFAAPLLGQAGKAAGSKSRLVEQVRRELVTLPYYSVFDNLEFRIDGVDTVVLSGQVTRPSLKSDAESAVRNLEAVGKVVNEIEVLPLSPNDDRLRLAAYRAIYSKPGLDRYALRAVPPIHIIVKNGHLRLVGVVANESDKNLANVAANGVSGIFSVENELRVENEK
jgi:hyperosmotically inducible protein